MGVEAGGEPVVFPALEIEPLALEAVRDGPLGQAEDFDLLIFVSPTAAREACSRLREMGREIGRLRAAAVGGGTAEVLKKEGVGHLLVPATGSDSEALLALPEFRSVEGRRVLIVRGEGGRALLNDELARRGARVQIAEIYRRVCPRAEFGRLVEADPHVLLVTSSEGLANLESLAGEAYLQWLKDQAIMVIHARIAERAREEGFRRVLTSPAPDDRSVFEALVDWWGGRASSGTGDSR